jgi:putative transposase
MSAVCATLEVARSNIAEQMVGRPPKRRGRPPLPDEDLMEAIKALISSLPTYGYRRVHALLVRQAQEQGRAPPNHKRVYRVMKAHGLLLQHHAGGAEARRHNGRVVVERSNLRWCSDGFEIGCDNGEKVRVAFALDCCDRKVLGHVATTEGIKGEDVQDLMITAVEYRFGPVNRLPQTIEWLSDNGSGYIAHDTKTLAREIGFEPRTTPVQSPQSTDVIDKSFLHHPGVFSPGARVALWQRAGLEVQPLPRSLYRRSSLREPVRTLPDLGPRGLQPATNRV